MVSPFDLILILIIFTFVLFGLWFGLLHTVGSLLGTFVGTIVASRYYTIWSTSPLTKLIAFLIIFVITGRLVGLIFLGLEKIFNLTKIIPGVSFLNRLLGGALGFFEGAIIIGVTLFFAQKLPFPPLLDLIQKSDLAKFLIQVGGVAIPLFPQVLKQGQELGKFLP